MPVAPPSPPSTPRSYASRDGSDLHLSPARGVPNSPIQGLRSQEHSPNIEPAALFPVMPPLELFPRPEPLPRPEGEGIGREGRIIEFLPVDEAPRLAGVPERLFNRRRRSSRDRPPPPPPPDPGEEGW